MTFVNMDTRNLILSRASMRVDLHEVRSRGQLWNLCFRVCATNASTAGYAWTTPNAPRPALGCLAPWWRRMGPTKVLRCLRFVVRAVTGHTAIHGGFPHSHTVRCRLDSSYVGYPTLVFFFFFFK